MWNSEYKHYVIILAAFIIIGGILIFKDDKNIEVKGQVLEVTNVGQDSMSILVNSNDNKNNNYDTISVTISPMTLVYRGDSSTRISYEEIKVSDTVEIIVKGGIRESYLVQADADAIRIIE